MGRPVTLPPTKGVGPQLSCEVVDAVIEAARERGMTQRAIYEIALRHALGLPEYPGAPSQGQEELPISA